MHMGTLENKVAIVTGASRGLGKNIAMSLAKEGATVIATARTENENDSKIPGSLNQTVKLINDSGGNSIAIRCDVSREEDVAECVSKVLKQYKKIDILVNNAGILAPGSLQEMQTRHFDLQYRINVRGPFIFSREVLPSMIENKWGHIINISSTGAIGPGEGPYEGQYSGGHSYGSTKAALERMTQGLAAENFQHNIAVNALSPEIGEWSEGGHYFRGPDSNYDGWRLSGEIIGDASALICSKSPKEYTGKILYDESVFLSEGWTLEEVRARYPVEPGDRSRR